MQYTLMHKNIAVADMALDEATSSIQRIDAVYRPEHLPVATASKRDGVDRAALNAWWIDRCIPASRSGVRKALETLELPNTQVLLTRCFGLSLSDQYWVRPHDSDLRWERINFFENPFSEDIGDVLLGKAKDTANFDLNSPDNTTNGYLKKRWKIIDGKRCLLKAGSNPFMQQPFNEVIASLVAEKLGISHVPYVEGMEHAVDQMIVLDYLIANEDRHQNNFGLLRSADTLEWLGAAPIFDSGSSLGYDKLTPQILSARAIECKPFKKTHHEQLKLVTSFGWIDFDRLRGVEQDIRDILDQAGEYVDESRKAAIISAFSSRLGQLMVLAKVQRQEDDVAQDVDQDRAQDYGFKMEL